MALNGLVLIKPTSVDITGSGSETATITTNGSVTCSACVTVSLNNVFSDEFTNYMIVVGGVQSPTGQIQFRLRSNGTDENATSPGRYVTQGIIANSTSAAGASVIIGPQGSMGALDSLRTSGTVLYLYSPHANRTTYYQNYNVRGNDGGRIYDFSGLHLYNKAFDGITIQPQSSYELTGRIAVYGFRK